jgi:geranylgeranyl diphosphate synthase type II
MDSVAVRFAGESGLIISGVIIMQREARNEFVEMLLKTYGDIIIKALLSYLPTKEPRRYLYDLLPSYPQRPGKGLRPGLCIATCKAFGGDLRRSLNTAVAIEMLHNAFLVHDDVEDGSEYRRGFPVLNAEYGIGIAVNAGDALMVQSMRQLMANLSILGPKLAWQIFREIDYTVGLSVEGQAMELGWVRDNSLVITEDDYLRMILKKTCWYTCANPLRIGALIATEGSINPNRFNRLGYYMGAAFQIQDDILNLTGDHARYGKEIGGDILEGKRTLMLIHALQVCSEIEKEQIRLFLLTPRSQRSANDVQWLYSMIVKYDCIDFARKSAYQLAGAALREFYVAFGDMPESDDKRFIHDIVLYMIERSL